MGIQVNVDGLYQTESAEDDHRPAAEGFRSEHNELMHACGHDVSTVIGMALEAVRDGDFDGTLKVFFQPASKIEGGEKPMAKGPHVGDVEYLFVVNVVFGHPTDEAVAGGDGMYAIERFRAEFAGESSHVASRPRRARYIGDGDRRRRPLRHPAALGGPDPGEHRDD